MAEDGNPWFVLSHSPGPAVAAGQSVFEHPGIGGHYAFLQRRLDAGELVAAGPMLDLAGHGMTVLRVGSAGEALRLATEDDQAVVDGVLQVTVRPWQVVMTVLPDR